MRQNDCSCTRTRTTFCFFSTHPIYCVRPSTPAPSLPGNNYSTSGIYNAAVVRSSDPGPQSRLFPPLPTAMLYHVRCVPCVFITRKVEHFPPSSNGIELCLHTLSTESSPPLPETLSSMRVKVQKRTLLPNSIIAVYH